MMTNIIIPHGIANLHTASEFMEFVKFQEEAGRGFAFTVCNYETEDGWKKARFGTIGASVAPTVMGLTDGWKKREQLFDEMLGRRVDNFKGNDLTRLGQASEPLMRALWAIEHPEYEVYDPTYLLFRNKERPWQTCSLDLIAVERSTGDIYIGEIKTGIYHAKWNGPYCPNNYFVQVVHELMTTEFEGAFLMGRIRRQLMGIDDSAWDKHYFYYRNNPAVKDEAKKIIKAETEFVEDLQKGVLRPTLNLCI